MQGSWSLIAKCNVWWLVVGLGCVTSPTPFLEGWVFSVVEGVRSPVCNVRRLQEILALQ